MAQAKPKKYEVGQHVRIARHNRVHEGVVEKVGRTLVHVDAGGWGLESFYMETGRGKDPYGYGSRLWTDQEWDEREERAEIVDRIRKTGFVRQHIEAKWTTDQLRRIAPILEES